MKKRLKINGFLIFIAITIISVFPKLFFRSDSIEFMDETAEIFGLSLILLGQVVRISARGFKSEHSQEGKVLIKEGPYSLVRNPMYLGILLIGLGIVLMLFNWWAATIFFLIFFWRYLLLVFKEERNLRETFSQEYAQYAKTTPRILPKASNFLALDISEYLPIKMAWVRREIGTIVAVLLSTLFIESFEDIASEGITVYLKEALAMALVVVVFIVLLTYLNKRTSNQSSYVSDKSKTN